MNLKNLRPYKDNSEENFKLLQKIKKLQMEKENLRLEVEKEKSKTRSLREENMAQQGEITELMENLSDSQVANLIFRTTIIFINKAKNSKTGEKNNDHVCTNGRARILDQSSKKIINYIPPCLQILLNQIILNKEFYFSLVFLDLNLS